MKPIKDRHNLPVYAILAVFLIIGVLVSLLTKSTGGQGDSTMHYLISAYAFKYPLHFFDHWGKPVFTLFSAPFAQFGFPGIKIFNVITAIATAYLVFRTSVILGIKRAYFSVVLLLFSPLYFRYQFTGLTEHFFAFWLILPTYLFLQKKEYLAIILLSFLPFVRSEGLVIIGVWLLYLLISRRYMQIPFLLTGHLLYSLAGWIFVKKPFLWIFTEIPYAHLSSPYGSGKLFHFFEQMNIVVGAPIYALIIIGLLFIILSFFTKNIRTEKNYYTEEVWLVYGCFGAFFVAHSLFWYFGIFNSMGLNRVLIDVLPLAAIMGLNGLTFIEKLLDKLNPMAGKVFFILMTIIILIFPFTESNKAIKWKKDFKPEKDQALIHDMAGFIKKNYRGYKFYYDQSYISIALGIDHFDTSVRETINNIQTKEQLPLKTLVIWEPYFSVMWGITEEKMFSDPRFRLVKIFGHTDGDPRKYCVFEYINPQSHAKAQVLP